MEDEVTAHRQKEEEEKTAKLQANIKPKGKRREEKKKFKCTTKLQGDGTIEGDENEFSISASNVTVVSTSDLGEAENITPGASA